MAPLETIAFASTAVAAISLVANAVLAGALRARRRPQLVPGDVDRLLQALDRRLDDSGAFDRQAWPLPVPVRDELARTCALARLAVRGDQRITQELVHALAMLGDRVGALRAHDDGIASDRSWGGRAATRIASAEACSAAIHCKRLLADHCARLPLLLDEDPASRARPVRSARHAGVSPVPACPEAVTFRT